MVIAWWDVMPSVETVCLRIWSEPRFRSKWLIGGILATIPLINILVAGYFLGYARRLHRGGRLTLPEWTSWRELLIDGLRMLVLKLVYAGIPALAGGFVSWIFWAFFSAIRMEFLALTVAMAPLMFGLGIGIPLWMVAIQQYTVSDDFQSLMDWRKTLRILVRLLPEILLPTIALWGVFALGWPLLGFCFFLGFAPYLAYFSAVYSKTFEATR